MKFLDELCDVAPPPAKPRSIAWNDPAWPELFKWLGARLPEDFVQFHKVYGRGHFQSRTHDYGNMGLWAPDEFLRPALSVLNQLRLVKELRPSSTPTPLFWEPGGFLPCTALQNESWVGWQARGNLVDNWPVLVVRPASRKVERFDMCLTEFLGGLFRGRLTSELVHKGLPGKKGVFFKRDDGAGS
jgi:hypothetical protein